MEEYNYRRESNQTSNKPRSLLFYSTLLFIVGVLLVALGFIIMILDHLQTAFPLITIDQMYQRYNYEESSFRTVVGRFVFHYYITLSPIISYVRQRWILIEEKLSLSLPSL